MENSTEKKGKENQCIRRNYSFIGRNKEMMKRFKSFSNFKSWRS
jgi:hypothetical protein